ncbi:hypothetical protein EV702DRAFT_1282588 [Suillus placidus]|uniref:Uncharacterized protein n=1 Tax=Suillus placidus TaxID=48579 RepID=A0A9P7CW53_9AGAM|nr:hypothetical protein EV702DRAFT_1282588 [Suillus placidus]
MFATFKVPTWVLQPAPLLRLPKVNYPYWRDHRVETKGPGIIPDLNFDESDVPNESFSRVRVAEADANTLQLWKVDLPIDDARRFKKHVFRDMEADALALWKANDLDINPEKEKPEDGRLHIFVQRSPIATVASTPPYRTQQFRSEYSPETLLPARRNLLSSKVYRKIWTSLFSGIDPLQLPVLYSARYFTQSLGIMPDFFTNETKELLDSGEVLQEHGIDLRATTLNDATYGTDGDAVQKFPSHNRRS